MQDSSLAAGVSRRERFTRSRAGTGRAVTRRSNVNAAKLSRKSDVLFSTDAVSEDEASSGSSPEPEPAPPSTRRRSPRGQTRQSTMPMPDAGADSPGLFDGMSSPDENTPAPVQPPSTGATPSLISPDLPTPPPPKRRATTKKPAKPCGRPKKKKTTTRAKQKAPATPATPSSASDSSPAVKVIIPPKPQAKDRMQQPSRRSGRVRFKPLEYWKNERPIYERRESFLGGAMPTIKKSEPLAIPEPTPVRVRVRKRGRPKKTVTERKKPVKRRRTRKQGGSSGESSDSDNDSDSSSSSSSSSDDSSDSSDAQGYSGSESEPGDPSRRPFPHTWVVGPDNQLDKRPIAVGKPFIGLQEIPTQTQPAPRAGKAFEADHRWFSSGVLVLPSKSVKGMEITTKYESFYVARAPRQGLVVQICPPVDKSEEEKFTTRLKLSRGDFFFIPPNNVYSLKNSGNKDIKLIFTLAGRRPTGDFV